MTIRPLRTIACTAVCAAFSAAPIAAQDALGLWAPTPGPLVAEIRAGIEDYYAFDYAGALADFFTLTPEARRRVERSDAGILLRRRPLPDRRHRRTARLQEGHARRLSRVGARPAGPDAACSSTDPDAGGERGVAPVGRQHACRGLDRQRLADEGSRRCRRGRRDATKLAVPLELNQYRSASPGGRRLKPTSIVIPSLRDVRGHQSPSRRDATTVGRGFSP